MADPTIQTFCCYTPNTTTTTFSFMQEFNTDAYNGVCLFSSTLGILGALYQILPRREFSRNHRWISFSAERGRKIILWLAISDLLASIGVLIRATLWLNYRNLMPATDDSSSVFFCTLSSAWIQYFYIATWVWTLCYAIDMRFVLTEKEEQFHRYHLVAWLVPAFLTTSGLSLLYLPDAKCHGTKTLLETVFRILPNYFATYIPITIVMIANPCLYLYSSMDMEKIITCSSGQFTRGERDIVDAIKLKFAAINIVFYVCWFPNLINGLLLWSLWFRLPVTLVTTIWYMTAFTNPLQAFFNCLVYRRWHGESETVIMPWSKSSYSDLEEAKSPAHGSTTSSTTERVPLLQRSQKSSINRYINYQ